MSEQPPVAARTAAALDLAQTDVGDGTAALLDAATAGEEVLVPVTGDGDTPVGMNGPDGPALVAFTDLDRLGWAMTDRPRVALVPLTSVLGLAVRAGAPLRLDATTPSEVVVEPAAAARLVEGQCPATGVVAAGSTFDPPRAAPSVPDAAAVGADLPPPHPEPTYFRSPDDPTPITADEARTLHQAGEVYVASIVPDDAADGGRIVVRVGSRHVVSERLDGRGRPVVVARFSSLNGLLFHDRVESRTYVDDGAEPVATVVVQYRPDGVVRTTVGDGPDVAATDSYGTDVADLWVPALEFSDYRWVLAPR